MTKKKTDNLRKVTRLRSTVFGADRDSWPRLLSVRASLLGNSNSDWRPGPGAVCEVVWYLRNVRRYEWPQIEGLLKQKGFGATKRTLRMAAQRYEDKNGRHGFRGKAEIHLASPVGPDVANEVVEDKERRSVFRETPKGLPSPGKGNNEGLFGLLGSSARPNSENSNDENERK